MTHLKVAVRIRPMSQRELEKRSVSVVEVENCNTIAVTNIKVGESQHCGDSRQRTRRFTFDYCFHENSTQDDVYGSIGRVISDSIKRRHNSCVLAYGQSSSGKTHTMMGFPHDPGLTPRLCQDIFQQMQEAAVGDEVENMKLSVSYLEIYNEKVRDLLVVKNDEDSKNVALKVREHPKRGPYVQGLTEHPVSTTSDLLHWLRVGNGNRSVASTQSNPESSRSHAVFLVSCAAAGVSLHLVDLAGSERPLCRSCTSPRWREGANINKSLVALGNVISALAERSSRTSRKQTTRRRFVPYRDSVLTWLLKDTLGGNSQTIMIANISPSSTCYSETVNTLRFGQRAKLIVSSPVVNEDPKEKIIRELRAEIVKLKELLKLNQGDMSMELEKRMQTESPKSPESDENTLEDRATYSINETNTMSNVDSLSLNPSPILEMEESLEMNEDTATCNDISEMSTYENSPDIRSQDQSKRSSVDSACSATEKIVPIISVESIVKEKTKPVPSLRRTFSEYAPFKMDRKNSMVFGSQEALSNINQIKNRKLSAGSTLRRKSMEKPLTIPKTLPQRKPLYTPPPKKIEKDVGTDVKDLARVESKIDSIRRQTPKPRSQIVAAVTHRLYAKTKKKEIGVNTDDPHKPPPKELTICSNARLKLKELTQKALKAHRNKDQITQTDLFPVLRVKEISTDVNDLRLCACEVKDAETIVNTPDMIDNSTNCNYLDNFKGAQSQDYIRNLFIVTKTCSTQVEEELLDPPNVEQENPQQQEPLQDGPVPPSFSTKYLNGARQQKPTLLESLISNPIYTNSVNINISHNYGNNGNRTSISTSEDSLDNTGQQNVCFQPPDLISNHNSLEPHNISEQVPESSENRKPVELKTRFSGINLLQDKYFIAEEFTSELPITFTCHFVTIPNNCINTTSATIPSVFVAEAYISDNKEDRCLPIPVFRPEKAKPIVTEYSILECDDCIVFQEPILMKSIMKLDKRSQNAQDKADNESSDDSLQSEREIPDSLDYHMANAKKVRFGRNRKQKKSEMLDIMSSFFEEASNLMNNITVAAHKLESAQNTPSDFDMEVTVNNISGLRSCEHSHRKKRRKHTEKHICAASSTQTEVTRVEDDSSQTVPPILLERSTQYDNEMPVNKYEALLEDSCRRLEEKINAQTSKGQSSVHPSLLQQMDELYLEDEPAQIERHLAYNPWDLTSINYNDYSSLESNPVTFSDYGSLPRKLPRRPRTSSCSPSAYLRQLTNMRKQVIESTRDELLNSDNLK